MGLNLYPFVMKRCYNCQAYPLSHNALKLKNVNNENMNVDFWKQVYVFKKKRFFQRIIPVKIN